MLAVDYWTGETIGKEKIRRENLSDFRAMDERDGRFQERDVFVILDVIISFRDGERAEPDWR